MGGVTECPIAFGETRVYRFKATQYGTSWYHSHYSVQYAEGIVGGIIINGPSTSNYDIDLGVLPFTDWFHAPMYVSNGMFTPPALVNILADSRSMQRLFMRTDRQSQTIFSSTVL